MPLTVEYCLELVIGYSLTVVHGLWFIFKLVQRFLKNPRDRFWAVIPRELPPECLNDPTLGNHRYVQLKNIKLHYVEAGDKSKPLMVFVHGFPEFWYSWRHQIKEFSTDYWVVAVDMRGYGESEKPVGQKNYKLELLDADIKNLIKALGRKSCTLVAHDWGGCVAWSLVLTEPKMFDAYIIMNSIHPEAFHQYLKKSVSQLRKSWYIFFFQLPWLPELSCSMDDLKTIELSLREESIKFPSPITDEDIEAYKFYFGKPGGFTAPINYYRANFLLTSRDRLSGLGKSPDFPPGLILFGDRDLYIDKEIQEDTIGLVANSTLVYVKDANHFVQQDDPVTVNHEMRFFLKKVQNQSKS
ncbi:epoxide hydrolase 4-like [Macrosteles quadrilineatus]|uniref:epoxide hydrolase 4-like n=1 Tax=Macrosteles quadrilineatus TaxID=74068 RepID=UPI0023E1B679|nr:epoxide hydrolase 4-like [Macrosteles quadrilineatus]